jgi:hypothetical protein
METKPSEPIRLTEGQTELLTKALLEASQQAAQPKVHETEIITKPLVKPVAATATSNRSAKKPMVL